jgi:peptidoglycan/xylan/chitin deacetylase (PgdA/CDA1 family)
VPIDVQHNPFRVPVLLYHSISDNPHDRLAVHPKLFQKHMEMLAPEFRVLSLDSLYNMMITGNEPENTIALTFDDGYSDVFFNALPVLEKFGFKAAFFLISSYIGCDNSWNPRAYTRLKHLDDKQVREISASGHTIGSHGLKHLYLPALDDQEAMKETAESRIFLENRFNIPVRFFSYPFGDPDKRILEMAEKHYDLAFRTSHGSYFDWAGHLYEVARIPVMGDMSVEKLRNLIIEAGIRGNSGTYAHSDLDFNDFLNRMFQSYALGRMGHGQEWERRDFGLGWLYYSFVRACRMKRCVVIGSWRGFVPAILAFALNQVSSEGEVIFIDPGLIDNFWHDPVKVKDYFADLGVGNVKHSRLATQEFVKTKEYEHLKDIDLLFVDGLHTYEQARFDFDSFKNKMRGGGHVFFHDSMDTGTTKIYGIDKIYQRTAKFFVDELKTTGKYGVSEFYIDKGLTVIQIPRDRAV